MKKLVEDIILDPHAAFLPCDMPIQFRLGEHHVPLETLSVSVEILPYRGDQSRMPIIIPWQPWPLAPFVCTEPGEWSITIKLRSTYSKVTQEKLLNGCTTFFYSRDTKRLPGLFRLIQSEIDLDASMQSSIPYISRELQNIFEAFYGIRFANEIAVRGFEKNEMSYSPALGITTLRLQRHFDRWCSQISNLERHVGDDRRYHLPFFLAGAVFDSFRFGSNPSSTNYLYSLYEHGAHCNTLSYLLMALAQELKLPLRLIAFTQENGGGHCFIESGDPGVPFCIDFATGAMYLSSSDDLATRVKGPCVTIESSLRIEYDLSRELSLASKRTVVDFADLTRGMFFPFPRILAEEEVPYNPLASTIEVIRDTSPTSLLGSTRSRLDACKKDGSRP